MQFLIDSGADVSAMPSILPSSKTKPTSYDLYAANGTKINVYGQVLLKLNLGLRREFVWNFVIADVSQPIIGADFLAYYELLPDLAGKCLLDRKTALKTLCDIDTSAAMSIKAFNSKINFAGILKQYGNITTPAIAGSKIKTQVAHHIETTGPPDFALPRRLSPEKLIAARNEFELLMKLGICSSI